MDNTLKQPNPSRRRFLRLAGQACGAGLLGLGLLTHARQTRSLPAEALRPPGALAEADFLAACVRCGLCVRDCPYDTLKLSELGDDVVTGTPYFNARQVPCEMCDDIPCVVACPTGALDKSLTDINQSRMGLAALVDQENCLNFLGLRCDVCYRVCPLINKAISLQAQPNLRTGKHSLFIPVVHSEACTGCGKCEHACVLPEAAIKVLPTRLAKGAPGQHYRLGWEEKEKAGGSLVTPDAPHQYNLPEGYQYDHAGEGLIRNDQRRDDQKQQATPFKANPLDTLNRKQEQKQ